MDLVDSPHAITIFVSVFGAILAPLYGVMVADYYLVKREIVNTPELYTMDASGRYHYDGGWNHVGLKSLAISGFIAIGWELCTQLFHILPPTTSAGSSEQWPVRSPTPR